MNEMAFCANCGAEVSGRFCQKCGAPAGAPGAAPAHPGQPAGVNPCPSRPTPVGASVGMTDNMAGALCYLFGFITGILFLVLAPYNQDRNIRFHAFQSIFLNIAWVIALDRGRHRYAGLPIHSVPGIFHLRGAALRHRTGRLVSCGFT